MKIKLIFLLVLVSILSLHAQESSGTKQSFIPKEWKLIMEASGDLNKDSVNDAALVIEYAGEALEGAHPRSLLILLKEKKGALYTQACLAEHAVILDAEMGGTLGDPLQSLEIKKGVVIVKHFGGSREQWETTHRYRFKDNLYFTVIGATYQVTEESKTTTYDYNLLNGNMIITTKDAANKANNKTANRNVKLTPINLKDFEPDALWAIMMPEIYDPVIVELPLTDAGLGDCFHIFFDDMDFGNSEQFLDEASIKLWQELTMSDANDDVIVNPKYKGKKFEITYLGKLGTKCEPEGETSYQLIVGLKLMK